jgi:hypothetical protein
MIKNIRKHGHSGIEMDLFRASFFYCNEMLQNT